MSILYIYFVNKKYYNCVLSFYWVEFLIWISSFCVWKTYGNLENNVVIKLKSPPRFVYGFVLWTRRTSAATHNKRCVWPYTQMWCEHIKMNIHRFIFVGSTEREVLNKYIMIVISYTCYVCLYEKIYQNI